jgi:hypothetical protein
MHGVLFPVREGVKLVPTLTVKFAGLAAVHVPLV